MKRFVLPIICIAVILAALTLYPGVQAASRTTLPGAAAVIDAADYPSIQAAIDRLPTSGGMVIIPPGTFEISEPLRVRTPDTLIKGSGPATHIRNTDTEGKPALVIEHPDGASNRNNELWRVQLADFRITGNRESGHGIEARRINEIYIQGVTVSYHGGDGVHMYYCYEDPRITSNLITYNKATGLNIIACHDIVVSANQFEENADALRCTDSFNLCMTGNNLDDHLANGVVIENTYGSVLSGNMIEECRAAAIVLDRDCYGITLSANVIAHDGAGIDLRDAHGCAVSANTFTIMASDALRIGPDSGRITVSANNFSNSYIGDDRIKRAANDSAAAGVTFEGAEDIAVTGNLFSSLRPRAITLKGADSRNILLSGNVLTDTTADAGPAIVAPGGGNIYESDNSAKLP